MLFTSFNSIYPTITVWFYNYFIMKNLNFVFIFILIVAAVGFVAVFLINQNEQAPNGIACTMDAMICPDGTAVGRVGPSCEFAPCPTAPTPIVDDIQNHIDSKANLVVVTSPIRGALTKSPLTITGLARGYWYFEATFPVVIVDWNGLIIGEGYAEAQSDWMTEDFVPFTATVTFTVPDATPYRRGALILQKSNASGLPENDDALEIPITF